jgi:energy-coupling factor transporter transmembrane protein EcfT
VCGIVGLVLFWTVWGGIILGILGIVFGAVGRARASQGAPNKGQATAGLWLGVSALLASILFIALIASVVSSSKSAEEMFKEVECAVDPSTC